MQGYDVYLETYKGVTKVAGIRCADGEGAKQVVQRYLSSRAAGRRLLVIDNVDDGNISCEYFGPRGGIHGHFMKAFHSKSESRYFCCWEQRSSAVRDGRRRAKELPREIIGLRKDFF